MFHSRNLYIGNISSRQATENYPGSRLYRTRYAIDTPASKRSQRNCRWEHCRIYTYRITDSVGIARSDTRDEVDYLSDKVLGIRVFADDAGKMNLNVAEAGGSLLVVSQFTLYGDCRKGRRPSSTMPRPRNTQWLSIIILWRNCGRARFRWKPAYFRPPWRSDLVNQGPVTILMDTADGTEMIETYGYARAGFLGNPSDGYFGKTLSFAMSNFRARVLLYPSGRLEIKPSKVDLPVFENLDDLYRITRWRGYYGGIRIIQALSGPPGGLLPRTRHRIAGPQLHSGVRIQCAATPGTGRLERHHYRVVARALPILRTEISAARAGQYGAWKPRPAN